MPPQRPVIVNPSQAPMSKTLFGEFGLDPSVFDSGPKKLAKKVAGLLGMDDPPDPVSAAMDFANPMGAVIGRASRLAPQVIRTLSGETVPRGIRAYHGSPYPPFDRLDINRIGTGEGSQAFGHGLYMAGNPKVGRTYQRNLSSRKLQDKVYEVEAEYDSWVTNLNPIEFENMWDELYRSVSPQEREFLQALRQDDLLGFDTIEEAVNASLRPGASSRFDLSPETLRTRQNLGSLAEVNLNVRPEELLDLDSLVGEQTPYVQDALRRAFDSSRAQPRPMMLDAVTGGLSPMRAIPDTSRAMDLVRPAHTTGPLGNDPRIISEVLREAGIPGSTYLDEASRPAGEGTRNIVMFGDEKIDIVKQLMLLLGIGAPAAAGAMQQKQDPRRPSMGSIR